MSDVVAELVRRYFTIAGGKLCIGGISTHALAEAHGTPLFVYDAQIMDRKLAALKTALPPFFSICYSIKANPNPAVVRHFLSRGCGLEIASAGEFLTSMQAGCDPKHILFAGPGKTPAELELTLSQGIGEIHVESLTECKRISAICQRTGIRANIAIRVNPTAEAEGGAMRMGGRSAPFGIDEELLNVALESVLTDSNLHFRGIHLFTGTQILDALILLKQYRHGIHVACRAAEKAGRAVETLDFGGGLGIRYFSHESELDLENVRIGLAQIFDEVQSDRHFSGTRFLVEPGRFLVGEAGMYIARVNDIKVSRGKKFLILDGGMNHHLAASGNLGQTIKRNYPIAILGKIGQEAEETVDIVGPLCTPLDTLARNVALPKAEIGDLVGIFQSGAYGRSSSPLGFLGHAAPPEVWIEEGQHFLVCRRGEFGQNAESWPLLLNLPTR